MTNLEWCCVLLIIANGVWSVWAFMQMRINRLTSARFETAHKRIDLVLERLRRVEGDDPR